MRAYTKPLMQVERYEAKNAVATGCYEEEEKYYDKQTINCIINGSDTIYNSTSGCTSGDGQTGYYNGTEYFVWYDGSVTTRPSDDQTALLSAIEKAVGYGVPGQSGWHAGEVTSDTRKKLNMTS